jgi:hypothetical protein
MAQKVFTTSGKKIIKTESSYDRFIRLQIALGNDFKSAYKEWKLLNCKISYYSQIKFA